MHGFCSVNGTENFCVSAVAEILGTASKVIIRKVVEPCSMAVPAMQPVPGSDHKEARKGTRAKLLSWSGRRLEASAALRTGPTPRQQSVGKERRRRCGVNNSLFGGV